MATDTSIQNAILNTSRLNAAIGVANVVQNARINSGINALRETTEQSLEIQKQIADNSRRIADLQNKSLDQQLKQTQILEIQVNLSQLRIVQEQKEREEQKLEKTKLSYMMEVAFHSSEEIKKIATSDDHKIEKLFKFQSLLTSCEKAGVSTTAIDDFESKQYVSDCLDRLITEIKDCWILTETEKKDLDDILDILSVDEESLIKKEKSELKNRKKEITKLKKEFQTAVRQVKSLNIDLSALIKKVGVMWSTPDFSKNKIEGGDDQEFSGKVVLLEKLEQKTKDKRGSGPVSVSFMRIAGKKILVIFLVFVVMGIGQLVQESGGVGMPTVYAFSYAIVALIFLLSILYTVHFGKIALALGYMISLPGVFSGMDPSDEMPSLGIFIAAFVFSLGFLLFAAASRDPSVGCAKNSEGMEKDNQDEYEKETVKIDTTFKEIFEGIGIIGDGPEKLKSLEINILKHEDKIDELNNKIDKEKVLFSELIKKYTFLSTGRRNLSEKKDNKGVESVPATVTTPHVEEGPTTVTTPHVEEVPDSFYVVITGFSVGIDINLSQKDLVIESYRSLTDVSSNDASVTIEMHLTGGGEEWTMGGPFPNRELWFQSKEKAEEKMRILEESGSIAGIKYLYYGDESVEGDPDEFDIVITGFSEGKDLCIEKISSAFGPGFGELIAETSRLTMHSKEDAENWKDVFEDMGAIVDIKYLYYKDTVIHSYRDFVDSIPGLNGVRAEPLAPFFV